MNIECDRCKKIYNSSEDTKVAFPYGSICEKPDAHLCTECARLLKDFIDEKIELNHKGRRQIEFEKYKKVQDDYYDSLKDDVNDIY